MKMLKILMTTSLFLNLGSMLLASEVLNLVATYKIPTISPEEENCSNYKLENYQVKIFTESENQPSEVSYTLPSEMVGEKTNIKLQLIANRDGVKYLAGENATAKCLGTWKQMKCEMRFSNLPVDLSLIESNLKQNGASEIEIKNRLQVLTRFSGDPIGFTEITL